MALGATSEHFSDEDCATRILPAVCPLTIDKEKIIRDSANRAIDTYLQRIRKAAADMPETALPPPQAAGANVAPRMGTPQTTEQSGGGWTGWAISSFTNKLSAAAGEMQSANSPSTATSPAPESKRPAVTSTASASNLHRQAVSSPQETSRGSSPNPSAIASAFAPPDDTMEDEGDVWGDMGDMDENDGFSAAPSTSSKPTAAASATPYDESEPDFEGWLAAQAQKKKPGTKPLPKGLTKSTATAAKKPAAKPAAKPIVSKKKIDLKPKDDDDDEGWGDGW